MNCKKVLALSGALAVAVAIPAAGAGVAAAGAAKVSVRIEGKTRTLLAPLVVQTHGGWITKGGVTPGRCPATSGQGALDVATRHKWSGTFSKSLGSYFIKTILGETENGPKLYWSIYVNNRSAATGACKIKLHPGDHLLFAAAGFPAYPTALSGPSNASTGQPFTVKVVWYSAAGKAKPLAGARVTGSGVGAVTNGQGRAQITTTRAGALDLQVSKKGYIRAVPLAVQVS